MAKVTIAIRTMALMLTTTTKAQATTIIKMEVPQATTTPGTIKRAKTTTVKEVVTRAVAKTTKTEGVRASRAATIATLAMMVTPTTMVRPATKIRIAKEESAAPEIKIDRAVTIEGETCAMVRTSLVVAAKVEVRANRVAAPKSMAIIQIPQATEETTIIVAEVLALTKIVTIVTVKTTTAVPHPNQAVTRVVTTQALTARQAASRHLTILLEEMHTAMA